MKKYYGYISGDLKEEKEFYAEESKKKDWEFIKRSGEMFLIHAYYHLFEDLVDSNVIDTKNYNLKHTQFYLNLAVGTELLLKSIFLKKRLSIDKGASRSKSFSEIINELDRIFPQLSISTLDELKNTLRLINLRRNNIAHRCKKSFDSYRHEYRLSYVILYIYEKFQGDNQELIDLLLKSLKRSKVSSGIDFKPLRVKSKSLMK